MGGRPRRLHPRHVPGARRRARIRARRRLCGVGATRRPSAEPRHRHRRRHVSPRPERCSSRSASSAAARSTGSRCCSTCPSRSAPDWSAAFSASGCGRRDSARDTCRTHRDPRHRHRDDGVACRAGRRHGGDPRPALSPLPAVDTVPGSRRVRRDRDGTTRARRGQRGDRRRRHRNPSPRSGSRTSGRARSSGTAPTGEPIAPALGWQDLRTVGECIMAKIEHGLPLAPNQSATKIAWLLANTPGAADRDLCFGTVDSWVAWVLSDGALHVTDHSNAAVTGLFQHDGSGWNDRVCEILGIPVSILPSIVDSSGVIGTASALPGAPPIAAMAGDQQASIGRTGLRAPRPGQDHVRHRRDARRVHGHRRARIRRTAPPTARSRSSPGHTVASSRGASRRSC